MKNTLVPSTSASLEPAKSSNAKRILFGPAPATLDGYYSICVPYLELSEHPDFETRTTPFLDEDLRQPKMLENCPIAREDLKWAEYLILPMLLDDHVAILRRYKQNYPNLKLVMHLSSTIARVFKKEQLHLTQYKKQEDCLLQNLCYVDRVISQDSDITQLYKEEFSTRYPEAKQLRFFTIPYAISKYGYEDIVVPEKQENNIIRIGLPYEFGMDQDYHPIYEAFKVLKMDYGDRLHLHIFGCFEDEAFADVPSILYTEFHVEKAFIEYFQHLVDLELDMVVYPMWDVLDESHHVRYLEACNLGIPFISYRPVFIDHFYDKAVSKEKIMHSTETWYHTIKLLIEQPEQRKQIGETAKHIVWEYDDFSKRVDKYKQVFS